MRLKPISKREPEFIINFGTPVECPVCTAINTTEAWNELTTKYLGNASLTESHLLGHAADIHVCPHCEEEIQGIIINNYNRLKQDTQPVEPKKVKRPW